LAALTIKIGLAGQRNVSTTLGAQTSAQQQKEILGPVLSMTTFKDGDEVLEVANDRTYGPMPTKAAPE
jgi:acyl-CoA reductase-like NAD-dependent aldehyde dehydrogenase